MKTIFAGIICVFFLRDVRAQYYYKDIIVPQLASEQMARYKQQRIKTVTLSSFESDGQPTEKFQGSQEINENFTRITTSLQSALAGSSVLISTFSSSGILVSSSDTTDGSGSTTKYQYTDKGEVNRIINTAISAGSRLETEEHIWTFAHGKPSSMMRIKDHSDTTFVQFLLDEQGNVAEESSVRSRTKLPSYFYYYDTNARLTDVVSYNIKAKRLLPDYVFEYNNTGMLIAMMVVPEGSSDYQKWQYEYHDNLKIRETVYNKRKQLLGTIKYSYD